MRFAFWFFSVLSLCAGALAQPASQGLEIGGFNGAFGPPTVSFSADLYLETGKNTLEGRVVYIPNRERWELRAGAVTVVSIIYTDLMVGYTVLPSQKTYLEVDHGQVAGSRPQWTVSREGEDSADGLSRVRYHARGVRPNGDVYEATMWLAEAYNLVVETRGTSTIGGVTRPVHLKLYNIRTGPQDTALFEPPPDYRRFGTGLDAPLAPPRVQP